MTDTTKLGESLWLLHLQHMRALEQIVDKSCTRGENGVLMYLYHAERPVYPGELTERLGLTTGRIANILRELERTGMIVRTPDTEDKRRVRVALTPEGESYTLAQNSNAIRFHARLLSQLKPEETDQFLKTLSRLVEIIERDEDIPNP